MPIAILVAKNEGDFRSGKGRLALTMSQAAGHLGVHHKTFEGFEQEGRIVPWPERLGPFKLYPADDVEKLKEERARQKQRIF